MKEQLNESLLSVIDKNTTQQHISINVDDNETNLIEQPRKSPMPLIQNASPHVVYQNENTTITIDDRPKESVISLKSAHSNSRPNMNEVNYMTEEMQLKAAYELQLWKEAKEKEFEQHLKKMEAKKFQQLAEAFKQHDIEREILVKKKIKEYSDLEIVLKNSLNEVEKRERQLALNEAQIARVRTDLNHEYENKLVELREASKRVQEKADHQVNLQRYFF